MRLQLIFFLLICAVKLIAQQHSADYAEGLAAYKAGNNLRYLTLMKKAVQENPEHDLITFEYMKALVLNQKIDEARTQISNLVDRRSITVHKLYEDEAFDHVLDGELIERIREIESPVINSDTVNVITERDLILEGIAVDGQTGRKFIGSTHKQKIVVINDDGQFSDFSNPADSLWSLLGMEVDEERGVLWAATAYSPYQKASVNSGCSKLIKTDLHTGRLLENYKVCGELLNDLTVTESGDVYVTGTLGARLYHLRPDQNELRSFLNFAPEYRYLNGLALGEESGSLYVAHETGVLVVDLVSKQFTELQKPRDISLIGIDGMSFYNNSLICHQRMLNSITRYLLSNDGKSVIGEEVIDANHPAFDSPTTGEIGGDGYYYYLANSQITSAYDSQGRIKLYKDLQDKIILRWKLPESH